MRRLHIICASDQVGTYSAAEPHASRSRSNHRAATLSALRGMAVTLSEWRSRAAAVVPPAWRYGASSSPPTSCFSPRSTAQRIIGMSALRSSGLSAPKQPNPSRPQARLPSASSAFRRLSSKRIPCLIPHGDPRAERSFDSGKRNKRAKDNKNLPPRVMKCHL
jgi:hypothetical protein